MSIRIVFSGDIIVSSCLSFGSLLKGDPKFLEILLHNCEKCPKKPSPFLLFVSYPDKVGIKRTSYFLSDRISYGSPISFFIV